MISKMKRQEYRAPSAYQSRILAFIDAQDDSGVMTGDVVRHLGLMRWKADRDLLRLVDRGFVAEREGHFYITPKAELFLNLPAA